MNVPSLRLLRFPRLPLLALGYALFIASFLGVGLIWSSTDLSGAVTRGAIRAEIHAGHIRELFFALTLLLPCGFGLAIAESFHEPFHRPLGVLLPSIRRRLSTGHAALIAAVAAALALAAHFVWPQVSPAASLGLALAALSLCTPLEPGMRWYGSRLASIAVVGILAVACFYPRQIQTFMVGHEALSFVAGMGIAFLCFALGYSRERLRIRAAVPGTTLIQAMGTRAMLARQQGWMRSERKGRRSAWQAIDPPKADGSLWSLVRLINYERWGGTKGRGRLGLGVSLVLILATLFGVGYGTARLLPDLYTSDMVRRQGVSLQALNGVLVGFLFTYRSQFYLPRMGVFYPFSRRIRLRVATAMSLVQEAYLLIAVLGSVCGLAWGTIAATGRHWEWAKNTGLVSAMVLLIAPLLEWAWLLNSRGRGRTAAALYAMSAVIYFAGIIVLPDSQRFMAAVFAPTGLFAAIAAVVIIHFLYFKSLRSTCLEADLTA